MSKTLQQAEYDWYATRTGFSKPANATLVDMKRAYWAKIVGGNQGNTTATDLEFLWLHKLTGVGASTKAIPDLWREAVVGAGITPTKDINENKFLYYTNVA